MSSRRRRTGQLQRRRHVEPTRTGLRAIPRGAVIGGALVLAALTLLGIGFVAGIGSQSELQSRVRVIPVARRSHVQGQVQYNATPPAGGDHNPAWQNCGYYAEPIVPESGVHSLEHGAVWVTYRPELPAAQVDALRRLAAEQTFIVVSPFEGISAPIVATAWGRQLDLESPDDGALTAFIREFRQGRTTPEPSAPCTGGIGAPQ